MAKKGRGKKYLVGGVIVVFALAVLLVDFDDIGEIPLLTGEDLTFFIPVPNSVLDSGFFPFESTGQIPLYAVECKVKQETKIYDTDGKLSRTEHSSGIQGNPQFTLSLVTPANVPVSHYTVIPKIFCEVSNNFPPIFVKPSDLTVQVYAQTNPASEQRSLVFTKDIRTFQYSFPNSNQVAEPSLGVVTIQASDIESQFAEKNFNSQLEFKVFGTLDLSFNDPSLSDLSYEIPIGEDQLRSFYVQPVRTDNEPDSDGDGIVDSADACPTVAENFNGYQDQDGCPDTAPNPTQPTICTGSGCPIINQVDCNNANQTWFVNVNGGNDVCFGGAFFSQGSFCKVYDSSAGQCIDPAPSSTPTGNTEQDNRNDCNDVGGVYRASNGLVITQVFTQDELESAVSTKEYREGSSSTITAYCLVPTGSTPPISQCTTESCVVDYAKDGRIVSQITITFVDNTTEVFLASESNSFSQGFVDRTLSIAGTTSSGAEKDISTIKYETFYVRDTLAEAQRLTLKGSTIQIIPTVKVEGSSLRYTLAPDNLGGSDTGLQGKSVLGGSEFGFLLGTKTFTASLIESALPSNIGGEKKLSFSLTTDGEIRVSVDSASGSVDVQGEQVTLDGFTLDRTIIQKQCLPDQVLNSKNLCVACPEGTVKKDSRTCETVVVQCTLPKIQIGNECKEPEDKLTLEECHNDFTPPREVVGNACQVVPVGGTTQICSDDHTTHSDFPCTIEYRIEVCGSATSTQCSLPVVLVCDADETIIDNKCEKIVDICQNGERSTTFNTCVERPSKGYCLSIDEIYNSQKDICESTGNNCNDSDYAVSHPDECDPDEPVCSPPKVLTGDVCHTACASNELYNTTILDCEVQCPQGQTLVNNMCVDRLEDDRDNDGFLDNVDSCPDQYAPDPPSKNGCPVFVGGTPPIVIPDIFNDPTFQLILVALIIIIAVVMIIRRRNSY